MNPKRIPGRLLVVVVTLTAAGLACSLPGGSGPSSEEGDSPQELSGDVQQEEEAIAPAAPELFIPVAGLEEITLTTPTEGAGEKPLFEWEAVDGAAYYSLVLFNPQGGPYWAWEGASSSVYLGGGSEPPPEDSVGPLMQAGMSWAVVAYADDALIASSVVQPIAP